ncbi:conserved hypothetical protein [Beutenbergia cavernae DSM 12333]|uniref:Integral membrane protein n=1 Tax=Beutenbergia cavernae (strain ATCC BAA-8 / DSM 12333 / CCUG 43141 / JCM 11478 / NBRC 16432 / NCIMB 13614 / HKI 0122) TaxID=471853 RepID=C5BWY9_BEUC1|nr:DUF4233 domain-containing protein [Beutenbergia cavernae]ACQ80805.1 conserved hypothetical protein [Beutenbergia cavernae DSM 12333]
MSDEPAETPSAAPPGPPAAPRRQRPARILFCSTVLTLEALVVGFAAIAAYGLRLADGATITAITVTAVAGCLIATATLRSGFGYWLGSAVQVGLIVSGIWLGVMYAIGGVFALIWILSLRLGGRIDRERAERAAAAR